MMNFPAKYTPLHQPLSFRRFTKRALTIAFISLCFSHLHLAFEQSHSVVSWNVESGGSDDQTVRRRTASFQGVDLWGLSE
jgi:hypothetical protein